MITILVLAAALLLALLVAHLIATIRAAIEAWRRRLRIAAWLAPAFLLVLATQINLGVPPPLFLLAAPVAAAWLWHRAGRPSAVITRWSRATIRKKGLASTLDILRFASARAMRRTAPVVRPSMANLTRREIARVKVTEVAVPLARAGGLQVHGSIEDVALLVGGPRRGKSGWLANRVIDFPGAVVTTSTRVDVMNITRHHRATGDRPVLVYNPGDLAGLKSTIGFNPLTGCVNPVTARQRADDMIPESEGTDNRSFWEGQARRVLAAYMHAAALGGKSMRDVQRWVARPKETAREVTYLLADSPEPAYEVDIQQHIDCNPATQTSVTASITPALSWLTSPEAYAATFGPAFDVAELLDKRGTVYLLGRHEAHTAPLLAALTGYIAREARELARGKRLDPPLGLFLDEAARIAPVPLPDWSGDFGGSGIFICPAIQSRADLVRKWGEAGASTIVNNAGSVMLYGGTKDPDDLRAWSNLAGERDEVVVTEGKDGRVVSRSTRKVPVLTTAQLANLPRYRVVLFRSGMPPAIGWAQMAWRRPDIARPLWWRVLTGARSYITRRPGVALPPPARVSPALGVAQSPAQSPAGAPAREVAGVGR